MEYILHSGHKDPAMRYESLAKYALGFNHSDARATVYDFVFAPNPTDKGIRILEKILDGLIRKESNKDEFKLIKNL